VATSVAVVDKVSTLDGQQKLGIEDCTKCGNFSFGCPVWSRDRFPAQDTTATASLFEVVAVDG